MSLPLLCTYIIYLPAHLSPTLTHQKSAVASGDTVSVDTVSSSFGAYFRNESHEEAFQTVSGGPFLYPENNHGQGNFQNGVVVFGSVTREQSGAYAFRAFDSSRTVLTTGPYSAGLGAGGPARSGYGNGFRGGAGAGLRNGYDGAAGSGIGTGYGASSGAGTGVGVSPGAGSGYSSGGTGTGYRSSGVGAGGAGANYGAGAGVGTGYRLSAVGAGTGQNTNYGIGSGLGTGAGAGSGTGYSYDVAGSGASSGLGTGSYGTAVGLGTGSGVYGTGLGGGVGTGGYSGGLGAGAGGNTASNVNGYRRESSTSDAQGYSSEYFAARASSGFGGSGTGAGGRPYLVPRLNIAGNGDGGVIGTGTKTGTGGYCQTSPSGAKWCPRRLGGSGGHDYGRPHLVARSKGPIGSGTQTGVGGYCKNAPPGATYCRRFEGGGAGSDYESAISEPGEQYRRRARLDEPQYTGVGIGSGTNTGSGGYCKNAPPGATYCRRLEGGGAGSDYEIASSEPGEQYRSRAIVHGGEGQGGINGPPRDGTKSDCPKGAKWCTSQRRGGYGGSLQHRISSYDAAARWGADRRTAASRTHDLSAGAGSEGPAGVGGVSLYAKQRESEYDVSALQGSAERSGFADLSLDGSRSGRHAAEQNSVVLANGNDEHSVVGFNAGTVVGKTKHDETHKDAVKEAHRASEDAYVAQGPGGAGFAYAAARQDSYDVKSLDQVDDASSLRYVGYK